MLSLMTVSVPSAPTSTATVPAVTFSTGISTLAVPSGRSTVTVGALSQSAEAVRPGMGRATVSSCSAAALTTPAGSSTRASTRPFWSVFTTEEAPLGALVVSVLEPSGLVTVVVTEPSGLVVVSVLFPEEPPPEGV